MNYNTDEEIRDFIERFENCIVPEAEFTHAAHLIVALWYCSRHDLETAIGKIRAGIIKLNESHGTPNSETRGYHETLTIFWTRTVWDFLHRTENKNSPSELAKNLVETCGDSKLPFKYYSRDRLFSPRARANWIEPDLEAIPFKSPR